MGVGRSLPELVVCSNRGPYSYARTNGKIESKRGGGGLIAAIAPVLEATGGTWIAAALSDTDREAARANPDGRKEQHFSSLLLDLPTEVHAAHYEIVSNEYLWFLFHYLFEETGKPVFDTTFEREWEAYVEVNRRFADAVARTPADAVLIDDYHLLLVGRMLKEDGDHRARSYFHHTPWCEAQYFSHFPKPLTNEILTSMLAYDAVGFHARRWADAFLQCCDQLVSGATVNGDRVDYQDGSVSVFVAPVPVDVNRLEADLASPQTKRWLEEHERMRKDRQLIVRVDRTDISKNPLRGFLAFEQLLERRPELGSRVHFLAQMYPSRLSIAFYQRYFAECAAVVERIAEKYPDAIELHNEDDFHKSLAALELYDVLLVNPVIDGLNLVAKEGAVVNKRAGSIVLSRNAGVYEQMGPATIGIDPFDTTGTADAIEQALVMPEAERVSIAHMLRDLATRGSPREWVAARLRAAGVSI
jgi:trehalose 6-phosphate synthase